MKNILFLLLLTTVLIKADEFDIVDTSKQNIKSPMTLNEYREFIPEVQTMTLNEYRKFVPEVAKIADKEYRKFVPLIKRELTKDEIIEKEKKEQKRLKKLAKDKVRIKENFVKDIKRVEKKEVKIKISNKKTDFFDTLSNDAPAPVNIE